MKPIWNGMISFGMVNIPVAVYSATDSERVVFHSLHKNDLGHIHNVRVCDVCAKQVPYDDIVRGYEYQSGEYVPLAEEDFERGHPDSKTINIIDFVALKEIDRMYFDTPYYLVPGKNADHAYVVLREALKRTEKIGIGKVVFQEREHLAAVKARGRALILDTMHFRDEIHSKTNLNLPEKRVKLKNKELKLAQDLVERMTGKFDPKKYRDTYRESLEQLIDAKLKGQTIEAKAVRRKPTTNVVDIASVLRASLESPEPKRETSSTSKRSKAKRKAEA
jgi:DNA end-binding protein Ku